MGCRKFALIASSRRLDALIVVATDVIGVLFFTLQRTLFIGIPTSL